MANEQMKISIVLDGKDNASPALNTVDGNVKKLKDTTDSSTASTKSFGETWGISANGLLAASAVIGGAIVQLNQLGMQANAAEKTFTQVSGGADEAAASLARMRSLTGGVIDDMSLMKGASSLLVTGIAQTSEQAEELVNLGARLGTVMGVDAAESIQNLNSALLNNSFMRLDTLGISAAAVRERVNELKEAGMDMSEAFSQAVLEIGTQTLTDLGSAAAVSETAINRLTTSFINMGQNVGQWVNTNLEQAATTLEQLIILGDLAFGGTGGIPQLEAQKAQYNELMTAATEYKETLTDLYQDEGRTVTASGLSVQEAAAFTSPIAGQEEAVMSGTYFQDAFNSQDIARINDARIALTQLRPEWAALTDEQLRMYALDIDNTFKSLTGAEKELAEQTARTTEAQAEQTAQMEAQQSSYDYGLELAALEERDAALVRSAQQLEDIRAQAQSLGASMGEGMFSSGGFVFFDPQQLAGVKMQTEAIVEEYERLKELGESSDFELVSEEDVERAREIAAGAEETAKASERNAAAWEKASLAMIAGAGGGGRENEFNQRVLAGIEDPEQRAALERQMNLNSGVENANTDVLNYGEDLVTSIFNEQGVAAASEASETFVTAFEEGIMAGLSGEALKTYIEGEVGFALSGEAGSSGAEITVQAGEGYLDVAARTGRSREELEAATGGTMLQAGQVITLDDGSALIAISQSQTGAEAANNILSGAFTQTGASMTPTMPMGTTYDPATNTYIDPMQAGMGDAQGSMFPPETAETTTQMATDMLSVETSVMNISQTDVSAALDPMIGDIDLANTGITEFEGSMARLTAADWSLEVPIAFVFDDQTAETLSRNSQVVEVVRLVLNQLQVDMPSQ